MPLVVRIVNVEMPDPPGTRIMLDLLNEVVGPLGTTVVVSETVPEKPLILVRVMLEVPDDPARIVKLV